MRYLLSGRAVDFYTLISLLSICKNRMQLWLSKCTWRIRPQNRKMFLGLFSTLIFLLAVVALLLVPILLGLTIVMLVSQDSSRFTQSSTVKLKNAGLAIIVVGLVSALMYVWPAFRILFSILTLECANFHHSLPL